MNFKKVLNNNLFVLLIISAVVIAVFGKSVTFEYVGLDEASLIDDRIEYLGDPGSVLETFFHPVNYPAPRIYQFYRPFFTISLIPDTIIGGGEKWIYNITNLALHILTAFSLFILLVKLKTRRYIAILLALLFSVHPLVTASAVWIPGRSDSLLGIVAILTFLFFIDFIEKRKRIYFFLHILFLILALFTKENAVALIPICYYFYFISRNKKDPLILKIPMFLWTVIISIWFVLRYFALTVINSAGIPIDSFLKNIPGLFTYIYKLIIPYQMTAIPTVDFVSIFLGIGVFGVLIILWISSKDTRRKINIGIMWILFFLLSSLLSYEVPQRMAFFEHRGYLVLIGFIIFISQLNFINNPKYTRYISSGLIFLIIIFSLISFSYSNTYKNALNFWVKAVIDTPELARSHKGLGFEYYERGLLEDAENELKKAIEIYPEEPRTHKYLGNLYYEQKRDEEAFDAYLKELQISSDEQHLLYKVAWLYARNGNFMEAEKYFLLMLDLDKEHVLSMQDLVVLYFERGDWEKSKHFIRELKKRNAKFNPEVARINKIYESKE